MATTFVCYSIRHRSILTYKLRPIVFKRCLSSKPPPPNKYIKPLSGLRQYFANKIFSFVKGYETVLEKKFPAAYHVYQVFVSGTKELYKDTILYYKLSGELLKGASYREFTRYELEKFHQVPGDILKVSPTLFVASLPLANYVILPLAYKYPHYFLSRQFWSLQQKIEFALIDHRKKLYHYRPVFRKLQAKVDSIQDAQLKENCVNIFYKLGSGVHPTTCEIAKVQVLFERGPYEIRQLSSSHLSSLCRIHGLSHRMPFKRNRLWKLANFMWLIDSAMKREGLDSMSMDELRQACFFRGLNPLGLSRQELCEWLENWVTVTTNISAPGLSMLLHCPILLSYNYSTNWVLIH